MIIEYKTNVEVSLEKCPLFQPFQRIVNAIFEKASQSLLETVGDGKQSTCADKGYKCIHLDIASFLNQIDSVIGITKMLPKTKKFLDVGCGVGQKVYLANAVFGFDSYGLELRQPYVDKALELLKDLNYTKYRYFDSDDNKKRVFQGNALTFDNYQDYDVIYFYCPIADKELEIELEKRIAQKASVGTIVLANLPTYFENKTYNPASTFPAQLASLGWEQIAPNYHIWKKIK